MSKRLVAGIVDGVLNDIAPAGVVPRVNRAEIDASFKASITAALENHPSIRRLRENLSYLAARHPQVFKESAIATNAADAERAALIEKIVAANVFPRDVAETFPTSALKQLTANAALMSEQPIVDRSSVGSVTANMRAAAGQGDNVVQMPDRVSLLNGSTDVGSFAANLKAGGGDK